MASDLGNVQKMYGQDLGIAVTNAPAKVLLTETSRIMPNTILISSPQNEKIDTGDYSIFVTDYNGYPSQITHVVKIGDGLYMDEDKAIHLGIDKNTIKYDELTNQLYVDSSSLSKASSNNYGVIKISNLLSRENQLYPQISGISINSNGELYISNNFIDLLYNYIDNRINSAIAPLLESKTNIKLYDVISNMYYFPSDTNEYSIQIISNSIKESGEENYIGIKNNIELSNKYIDSLLVNINISSLSNTSLCKTDHFELNTTVINEQDINGIKFYDHIIKNLIIQFYPNLLNQNIEYNMIVQVQEQLNSEETNLISNNSFKLIQYSLSTNKNDLGYISNIYIDDENKIISINYFINNNILEYIQKQLIDSISLKLIYNNDYNNPINIDFINNSFNINENIIQNYSEMNNLISWELSYKINNVSNPTIINNGICELIINKVNITKYTIKFGDRFLYDDSGINDVYLHYIELMESNNYNYYISDISDLNYLNNIDKYIIKLSTNNVTELNNSIQIKATSLYQLQQNKIINSDDVILTINQELDNTNSIFDINCNSNNIQSLLPAIKIQYGNNLEKTFNNYINYCGNDEISAVINIINTNYEIRTDNNIFKIYKKTEGIDFKYIITFYTDDNDYIQINNNQYNDETFIDKLLQIFIPCINNNEIGAYYKCILNSGNNKSISDLFNLNIDIHYEVPNSNAGIYLKLNTWTDDNKVNESIINNIPSIAENKKSLDNLLLSLFKEKSLNLLLNQYNIQLLNNYADIVYYKVSENNKDYYYQGIEFRNTDFSINNTHIIRIINNDMVVYYLGNVDNSQS